MTGLTPCTSSVGGRFLVILSSRATYCVALLAALGRGR